MTREESYRELIDIIHDGVIEKYLAENGNG